MDQQSEQSFSLTPSLKNIGVEITGRCNLNCRHCFNRSGGGEERELALADLKRIFDEACAGGVRSVRLSGGEPTLHRQFPQVVQAARQRGLTVSMNTNGVYSERIKAHVLEADIAWFIVSLDGLRENNDRIRGTGMFNQAMETVRWLRAHGRGVMIGVHLCQSNCSDVGGLVALAAELGVDIKFSPVRPIGRAQEQMADEILSPARFYQAVWQIVHLRRQYPNSQLITDFDILDEAKTDCQLDLSKESCMAGRTTCNVSFDGYVYPCAFLMTPQREFAAGSIHKSSLRELWQKAPMFQRFRTLRKSARCQSCFAYRRSCVGGCPAVAYFAMGDLEAHDPTCFIDYVMPPA